MTFTTKSIPCNDETKYEALDYAYRTDRIVMTWWKHGFVDIGGHNVCTNLTMLREAHRMNEELDIVATSHAEHAEDTYVDPAEAVISSVWSIMWNDAHSDALHVLSTCDYDTLQCLYQTLNSTPSINRVDSIVVLLNNVRVYGPYFMEMDTEPKN